MRELNIGEIESVSGGEDNRRLNKVVVVGRKDSYGTDFGNHSIIPWEIEIVTAVTPDLPESEDVAPPTPTISEPDCQQFSVDGTNYLLPADWTVYQPNPNHELDAEDAAFLERPDGSLVVAPWHTGRILEAREGLDNQSYAISTIFGFGSLGAGIFSHPATATFTGGISLIATTTNPPGIETVGPPEHECEG